MASRGSKMHSWIPCVHHHSVMSRISVTCVTVAEITNWATTKPSTELYGHDRTSVDMFFSVNPFLIFHTVRAVDGVIKEGMDMISEGPTLTSLIFPMLDLRMFIP